MSDTTPVMEKIYVWVESGPDGKEGVIAAIVPLVAHTPVPLMSRSRELAQDFFKPIALGHRRASGNPVRLLEFSRRRVLDELT